MVTVKMLHFRDILKVPSDRNERLYQQKCKTQDMFKCFVHLSQPGSLATDT